MSADQRVCTIGLWHLGSVISACLSELGYDVVGVDSDLARVRNLNNGKPPLFEPGLEEMLQRNLEAKRLRFTHDLAEGVRGADVVMLTFDTPVNSEDELDLTPITATINAIAPSLGAETLVIVQSQIPVGTCAQFREMAKELNPDWCGQLSCVPENLRLGQAISRYLQPAFLVIGADEEETRKRVDAFFVDIQAKQRIPMDLKTAEMTKHSLNAFFATCVSFANELGMICDEIGSDGFKIAEAMRLDERIGPKALLFPGAPFGGGTLARDLKVLQKIGKQHSKKTLLVDAVLAVNNRQKGLVRSRLLALFGKLKDLQFGILGLTYKAGTSTLRRSPTIELIQELLGEGAHVRAFDPKADLSELSAKASFEVCEDALQVASGADALIIATEWPEFKELDYSALRALCRQPILLDTKNLLDPDTAARAGFRYFGIGRGSAPAGKRSDCEDKS